MLFVPSLNETKKKKGKRESGADGTAGINLPLTLRRKSAALHTGAVKFYDPIISLMNIDFILSSNQGFRITLPWSNGLQLLFKIVHFTIES